MQSQLDRLEAKLDQINEKLDNHLERIAKAETSITWLKWVLSLSGVIGLALTKYLEK